VQTHEAYLKTVKALANAFREWPSGYDVNVQKRQLRFMAKAIYDSLKSQISDLKREEELEMAYGSLAEKSTLEAGSDVCAELLGMMFKTFLFGGLGSTFIFMILYNIILLAYYEDKIRWRI